MALQNLRGVQLGQYVLFVMKKESDTAKIVKFKIFFNHCCIMPKLQHLVLCFFIQVEVILYVMFYGFLPLEQTKIQNGRTSVG